MFASARAVNKQCRATCKAQQRDTARMLLKKPKPTAPNSTKQVVSAYFRPKVGLVHILIITSPILKQICSISCQSDFLGPHCSQEAGAYNSKLCKLGFWANTLDNGAE